MCEKLQRELADSTKERTPLSEFVNRIWNHPFAGPEVEEFRHSAMECLFQTFDQNGISDEQYCALLVGSAMSLPDNCSDFDFIVFAKEGVYSQVIILDYRIKLRGSNLDILEIHPHREGKDWKRAGPLGPWISLFVPDEFIVGSKIMAASLREEMVNNVDSEKVSWGQVLDKYNIHIRDWHFIRPWEGRIEKGDRNRLLRGSGLEDYPRLLSEARLGQHIPNFEEIKSSLLEANYHLV